MITHRGEFIDQVKMSDKISTAKAGKGDLSNPETLCMMRVTLSGTTSGPVEKACTDISNYAFSKNMKVRGPMRMPTKHLHLTTRKTPCGQGSKTWDHFEMSVHKRVVDLISVAGNVEGVSKLRVDPSVIVELQVVPAPAKGQKFRSKH